MSKRIEKALNYFACQNASDKEGVVDLFDDSADVYNVNLPPVNGKDGVRIFCENLYARTSKRQFKVIETAEGKDCVMIEWQAKLDFRLGAKIGPWELASPFEVELRGINKFEFATGTNLIRCLRIYHETTSVAQLAQKNAKPN